MSRDPVSLSHRFYSLLLNAYPPGFQSEYGQEMARVFRDSCRADYRQRGAVGLVGQWTATLPDLVVSLADEHPREGFQMAKTNLIRVLTLAGIVGGALWIAAGVLLWTRPPGLSAGYREADDLMPLLFLGMGCLAAGLPGIFLGPGRQWPA